MAGRGKSMVEYDWLTAYETARLGMVELDQIMPSRDGGGSMDFTRGELLESTTISSPEEILLKKEAFLSMSQEAKEIVQLIFNAPQEIIDCFMTETYEKVSKKKIKEYLIINGWHPNTVKKCFGELREFTTNLC